LLVHVNILNTNKTFSIAFSFCSFEFAEFIGFIWESMKAEYFIDDILPPRVIIGD
jgi:hypothetical protein